MVVVLLALSGLARESVAVGERTLRGSSSGWALVFPPAVGSTVANSTSADDVVALRDVGAAEATQTFPYKQFLPLVAGDAGSRLEVPFGVEIYSRDPVIATRTHEAGARWARIPFHWDRFEPQNTTPENYNWSASLEQQLVDLSAKNVRVIFTLNRNPSWAATYLGGPIDLVPMSELVEFVTASVARYGAPPYNVKYWEIYNEPDNGDPTYAADGWGYFGDNPQGYVDVLAALYGPIKAVDPDAKVVLGGLAHDWFVEEGGPFVRDFVDNVLLLGGGAYFDVMNFHYYVPFHIRWDQYGQGIIGKATSLRERMASQGVVDKPFICTESGMWSSEYSDPPGSDEIQSRYVAKLFARSAAADLDATIWYTLVDHPDLGHIKRGLINSDYTLKPAYIAYQTMAQQLGPAEYVRTLSHAETGSDWIEAYAYITKDGTTNLYVAWTRDELERNMSVATSQLVVVDKFGAQTILSDGDDGTVDGQVTVTLGPSPQFLRFSAGAVR
jgi:hypothetical protein